MSGPSLKDHAAVDQEQQRSLDAQLKAWFDALLKAPLPPYLIRHVEKLSGEREPERD